jgi:hypothetical protein
MSVPELQDFGSNMVVSKSPWGVSHFFARGPFGRLIYILANGWTVAPRAATTVPGRQTSLRLLLLDIVDFVLDGDDRHDGVVGSQG